MSRPSVRQVPCPSCRRPARFSPDNPWRPFCSERCKTGDLGAWASNAYVIAGKAPEEDAEGIEDDVPGGAGARPHPGH